MNAMTPAMATRVTTKRESCIPMTMANATGTGKIPSAEGRFLRRVRKGLPTALPTSIASRICALSMSPSALRFAATAEDCTKPPICAATTDTSSAGKKRFT